MSNLEQLCKPEEKEKLERQASDLPTIMRDALTRRYREECGADLALPRTNLSSPVASYVNAAIDRVSNLEPKLLRRASGTNPIGAPDREPVGEDTNFSRHFRHAFGGPMGSLNLDNLNVRENGSDQWFVSERSLQNGPYSVRAKIVDALNAPDSAGIFVELDKNGSAIINNRYLRGNLVIPRGDGYRIHDFQYDANSGSVQIDEMPVTSRAAVPALLENSPLSDRSLHVKEIETRIIARNEIPYFIGHTSGTTIVAAHENRRSYDDVQPHRVFRVYQATASGTHEIKPESSEIVYQGDTAHELRLSWRTSAGTTKTLAIPYGPSQQHGTPTISTGAATTRIQAWRILS